MSVNVVLFAVNVVVNVSECGKDVILLEQWGYAPETFLHTKPLTPNVI